MNRRKPDEELADEECILSPALDYVFCEISLWRLFCHPT
jgi:hypothetical protein